MSKHPIPAWLRSSPPINGLSSLYAMIIQKRNHRYDLTPSLSYKSPHFTISIGGIRAGGTGKTPFVKYLASKLIERNKNVAILSRGYKRKSKDFTIVLPNENTDWEKVGDEPALIHKALPKTWLGIGSNRSDVAKSLQKVVPENTIFLLDDGFQHRKLYRNLDIVCVHEKIYDDVMIPKGFLREPISNLKRAHIILLNTLQDDSKIEKVYETLTKDFPQQLIFQTYIKPAKWINLKTGEHANLLPLKNPIAICGIARPERFFKTLENLNIKPSNQISFPDHYAFKKSDFHQHDIYSKGIVTTEKDALRLEKESLGISDNIWYLTIEMGFRDSFSESQLFIKLDEVYKHY